MSDWSKVTRPIPVPNEWTKPFWEAAKQEQLAVFQSILTLSAVIGGEGIHLLRLAPDAK